MHPNTTIFNEITQPLTMKHGNNLQFTMHEEINLKQTMNWTRKCPITHTHTYTHTCGFEFEYRQCKMWKSATNKKEQAFWVCEMLLISCKRTESARNGSRTLSWARLGSECALVQLA